MYRYIYTHLESPILGVWPAPATPKTIPEGGGLRPTPSGMVFGAATISGRPGALIFGRFWGLGGLGWLDKYIFLARRNGHNVELVQHFGVLIRFSARAVFF